MADNNCAKCRVRKKDGLVGCEGSCKLWFHYSCVQLSENDFKVLEKSKNLFFLCDACRINCEIVNKSKMSKLCEDIKNIESHVTNLSQVNNTEILNELISNKHTDMLCEMELKFKTYKEELQQAFTFKLEEVSKNIADIDKSTQNASYASVVKTKASFIVQPIKTDQSTHTTKTDVLRKVDPVAENINIANVKPVRNGGLVISCNKGEESTKFNQLLNEKLGENYKVKQVPSLLPRLKIVGFSDKYQDNILLNYIKAGNRNFFMDNSVCDLVYVKPLRNNNQIYQALIQVDIETYNRIIDKGKIFVGYDYCSVYDAIDVKRCYKCCGFHHIANKCIKDTPVCPKCSGNHFLKECTATDLKCVHCSNLNSTQNMNIDTQHAVWDPKCHVYKEIQSKMKAKVLGGQ